MKLEGGVSPFCLIRFWYIAGLLLLAVLVGF